MTVKACSGGKMDDLLDPTIIEELEEFEQEYKEELSLIELYDNEHIEGYRNKDYTLVA